ncbi:alginate export family protein [Tahibacter amnicola]|uniref:Alginate export family protein n=1 Tax=Tahibacter amnicola TaxID=2976241 RepID=A0ABY6BLX2_9GAMM|nr:alginate export family protein [Tahibacter amnicola]UXI70477.1 alginate export family protein [Tahibacter amnicola]
MRSVVLLLGLLPTAVGTALAEPTLKPVVDLRIRYEHVDDARFAHDAQALTVRARAGLQWAISPTWTALVEAEATQAVGADHFNSTDNRRTNYPTVVDPDNVELNQAWVAWAPRDTFRAVGGRQRLIYENQRFIGNVGWRQNEQTFDAIDLSWRPEAKTTLRYSYLDRVQRVFGNDHSNASLARWDLDGHLVSAARSIGPGTLTVYGHWIENRTLVANSQRNAGIRYVAKGGRADGPGWHGTAEVTRQSAYGGSHFSAQTYVLAEGGVTWPSNKITVGYERLGGDGRYGFSTPLATLHAFNGWADLFLTTPPSGLQDRYAGWRYAKGPWEFQLWRHRYSADAGSRDYGREWNALASRRLSPRWSSQVKFARYASDGFGADVSKLWISAEYKY